MLYCSGESHNSVDRAAFDASAHYIARDERGVLAVPYPFGGLGVELGRDFRALKLWISLKTHGRARYAGQIEKNIAQARYLARLVDADAELELMAPVTLNVVCFRVRSRGDEKDGELDTLNREVLLRLHESGIVVPSSTRLGGRLVLRVTIANHRSRFDDFDAMVSAAKDAASEVRRAAVAAPSQAPT
ncbi:MAG TPA: pyridoxal-dependent decarboxylase [Longimicrobiaceae bacterium]|nr:pyridoxal-dependent decarboxylase [Longimicrobiaceae bacterium]